MKSIETKGKTFESLVGFYNFALTSEYFSDII